MQNKNSKFKKIAKAIIPPKAEYQRFVQPSQPKRRSRQFCALRFKFSGGFTLLETIIALAVITSAIVGPFTLATKGILSSSFSKNKIIAANLAEEGIELVRHIRENNILALKAWDNGLSPGTWQTDIFSSGLSPFSGTPLLFDSTSGIYSQTSGSPTLFTRKITISKPSSDEMIVVAEVSWSERSIDRRVVLGEKLYNWK